MPKAFSYSDLKNIFLHFQTNNKIHEIRPFLQNLPVNRSVKKDLLCQNLRDCHQYPSILMTLIEKNEIALLKIALKQILQSKYHIEQINKNNPTRICCGTKKTRGFFTLIRKWPFSKSLISGKCAD